MTSKVLTSLLLFGHPIFLIKNQAYGISLHSGHRQKRTKPKAVIAFATNKLTH